MAGPAVPRPLPANPPHDTRIPLVLGVEITLAVLMVLVVLTRFYIRTFVKAVMGIDDWIMGVAMVRARFLSYDRRPFSNTLQLFALIITIIHCCGTHYGTGKHWWDVPMEKGKIAVKVRSMSSHSPGASDGELDQLKLI